jgi:pilus assembly protein CpaC
MAGGRRRFHLDRALALAGALLLALASPAEARRHHAHGHAAQRPAAAPADAAVRFVAADPAGYGGQLALPIGGSKILKFAQPIGRVMVGDPKVADVVPLSDRTIYVLGKAAGASSLTVLAAGGERPLAAIDLRVGYDLDGVRRALHDILPDEGLKVSAEGGGLVLSGVASSSVAAARAQAIAEQYAPQKVVNLASVRGPEQVMLQVHVAEVQRTALMQLGLSHLNAGWDGTDFGPLVTQPLNPDAFVSLIGRMKINNDLTLEGVINALETKGYASTLAEPTLTALSGETAVFFAGGEFPVPVPQISSGGGQSTITVDYKQYGVSVRFTPTVYGDTINLQVAPEVSALDRSNSVTVQGFNIPGISTRRAKTTIELRNGQSFAIAGLIKRDFTDSLSGFPGASKIPILGALFRSTSYQNNETEVVIIVTAHLAQPTDRKNLRLPTDSRVAPSEAQLLLTPTTDEPKTARPTGPLPSEAPRQ